MRNNVLIYSLNSLRRHLDLEDKKQAVINFVLIFFTSLLDVFGLASIIPVILAAAEPDYIHTNKYLNSIYIFFHFNSERNFLAFLIITILIFFIVKNTFSIYIYRRQVRFTASVGLKLNAKQFSKHNNIPFNQYIQLGSAKIIRNINNAPATFLSGILQPLILFISESIMVTIIILGIAIYQPSLFAILAIVLGPATMLIYKALKNKSALIGKELEQLSVVSYNILADSFSGYIELKLANKQDYFQNKYIENQKKDTNA